MKRVFTIPERTHGPGPVFLTWQRSHANYLVTTGYDHSIIIHDRHGDRVDSINLPGSCSGLSWDFEGAMLAAICDRSPLIFLWDSSTHRLSKVDTAVRDILTLLVWSKKTHLLAVGTSKGNILIYNHQTSRKVPILGKHAKKINSGCWSDQNMLALTGDDRLLTVSNEEGDTICQCDLKGEASLVHFSKLQNRDGKAIFNQECVSLVLNKRNLFILNINDPDRPYVLEFREKYGKIIDYQWFGEGNILVGFSSGLIVVISTLTKKMGQELATVRAHQENLIALTASISTKRVASCSENVIKFFDIDQLEDIKSVLVLEDEKAIEWMEWTDDGQLIALASSSGAVHVYLTKLTILGSSFGTRIAYLSSLLELTVASVSEDLEDSLSVLRIDVEPSLIAVGPYHVATCINNRAWFYSLMRNENQLFIKEKEYPSILKSIKINGDYVAALFTDGKLQLHSIDEANTGDLYGDRDVKVFHGGESSKISSISLTNEFLIYGTESGLLEFFSLEDWSMVNVHRHTSSIKFLEPDCSGLRLIAIDSQNQVFLYNSINGTSIVLKDPEDFPANIRKIFWESWSPNKGVFIISDERTLFIYSYVRDSIYDQTIEFVGRMKIPINQYPLMLYNGVIVCQTESGKTSTFLLSTHDLTDKMNDHSRLRSEFLRDILKLRRYQDAWKICESLDEPGAWKELGKQAMIDMDISFALRVYRKIQDAGMVYSLESLKNVEERNLIAGWMAQYLGDFDLAQKMFLSSSKPREALEMRQNLQDWDAALLLANRLSKESIPLIAREYAGQLEFQGDYRNALDNFEKACQFEDDDEDPESNPELSNHIQLCKAGIARTSMKCGDIKKGMKAILELSNNQSLLLECASILEASKHYPEAAKLYELGENFEKSAKIYMNLRDNQKVGEIISKSSIKNSDLIARYARVKETESNYQEAISLYLRAGDHLNAVRLLLDKINDPGEAARIVRENKSTEGAKMMARFFQRINDIDSAIEFLVISNFNEEAFQLAVSTSQVDTYANVLMNAHESGTNELVVEDFHSLAVYYDQNKSPLRAGKFYCLAKKYSKGIKLLLQSISSGGGDEKEAMKIVINAASKSKDEQVIRTVIDFLMGESDGEPKDFKYLFRLYMALRQFKEAAQTAIVISKEEQNAGNYRNAHDLLFAMSKELLKQNIPIPMEMESSLLLIHSYLLAKAWIKIGDHLKSAQLLIRVSKNISKFPSHIVPILTSTVIECQRSGLKTQAFNYATMLMKPEYRDKIEPKIKRKIEALVRKSVPKTPESSVGLDIISKMSPCPHCGQDLLEIELICGQCRGNIPFCLATGYHITQKDLTSCPSCQFPAIRAYFNKYLEVENVCPMCYSHVESKDLKEEDISRFLKS